MEKATLKSIIIGLKISGLSFADISARLKDDYDIEMSRQAVCGMYNRAMSKDKEKDSVAVAVMTTDVCRYISLGLSINEVAEITNTGEYNLTLSQIKGIIKNNKDVINEMIDSYVKIAVNDIEGFKDKIKYNNKTPSEKIISLIEERAINEIFVSNSKELLKALLNKGVDKALIKNTAKKFNIANNISEL